MFESKENRLCGRRVAAIACFDSFGKMAMKILSSCRQEGAQTRMHLLEISNRGLSRRQLLEIRRADPRTPIEEKSWQVFRSLSQSMTRDTDVVILALDGRRSREALLILAEVWKGRQQRPLIVSAYPGILFRFALEGMLDRSGVDLLCLNSSQDLKLYLQGCSELGMEETNAIVTGLPILWNVPNRRQNVDIGSIVFFEQPSIPPHPLQRRYLCRQIKKLAETWPEHQVIFKPRTSSLESTLHRRHGEMASVIAGMAGKHHNLELSFKPAIRLLSKCGCAITVSSTAALEAMAMGVSTRIVSDLGITETLGNHFFTGSGALTKFHDIQKDPFSLIHDNNWLQNNGGLPNGEECFLRALLEMLEKPRRSLPEENIGPLGWGSPNWQKYAIHHGGRHMLSSSGASSSLSKSHRTRSLIRRIKDYLIGLDILAKLLRK